MVIKPKLLLIGPPGVGKGTLAQTLPWKQISTGDVFRSLAKQNTPLSATVKNYLDQGLYVPDDLTNQTVKSYFEENQAILVNGFVLDGYPRTLNQAEFLASFLKLDLVVELQITNENELVERILNRMVCSSCKRIYNKVKNPPKNPDYCDFDQTKLTLRQDDNETTIKKRLVVYETTIRDLKNYYQRQNLIFLLDVLKLDLPAQKKAILAELEKRLKPNGLS